MPVIVLTTTIQAPIEVCFDLSRSIDLHSQSVSNTKEKAIGGRTSGLIECGEYVTWEAVHFGFKHRLSSKIIELSYPNSFCDTQIKGIFHHFVHHHTFSFQNGTTTMTDTFEFASPFGIIGELFDYFILKNYMTKFLVGRNEFIKKTAESEDWKKYLPQ
ncbi:MAG: SRPBCC family protein [Bacteroidia bacterium]|nr:SRPBCC family protein [Bacteroidia bacterium]